MEYFIKGPQGGIAARIQFPSGFDPKTDKRPAVIVMHGFCSSMRMLPVPSLARAFRKAGFVTVRFDFDAHGRSEGLFEKMTISSEIADARAVVEYVRKLPYVSKIAFAGHSQGGVVAGMLAGQLEKDPLRPDCLIQLAPAAVLKDDALNGVCMGNKYNASNPPEYVKVLGRKLGREFILEAQKLPIYETSSLYSGPVCLIHGTKDNIVPLKYGERYAALYKDARLHIIPGCGHFMLWKLCRILKISTNFLKEQLES